MAAESKIEWTDSTFSPWIGCTKVSPACDHCYAEAQMDTRLGSAPGRLRLAAALIASRCSVSHGHPWKSALDTSLRRGATHAASTWSTRRREPH